MYASNKNYFGHVFLYSFVHSSPFACNVFGSKCVAMTRNKLQECEAPSKMFHETKKDVQPLSVIAAERLQEKLHIMQVAHSLTPEISIHFRNGEVLINKSHFID